MTDGQIEQIIDSGLDRLDGAFQDGVSFMVIDLFELIGEQAPVEFIDGVLKATEPATPGAPPRRVTGWLQSHIGFEKLGRAEWVYGIRRGVAYARVLEFITGHPYFGRLIHDRLGQLTSLVASRFKGGV